MTQQVLPLHTHETVTFEGKTSGPHLLVTGAVHGNETCGPKAIYKIIAALKSGDLSLQKGRVTFIPVCNPRAFAENVRFIDSNLNRSLFPTDHPTDYEGTLKSSLCHHLGQADIVLDLHSYSVNGKPFIFVGSNHGPELEFAKSLGAEHMVYGWSEAYGADSEEEKRKATGTTEYARLFGGLAVTMECGGHEDEESPYVAEEAIRRAFAYLGLTGEKPKIETDVQVIKMQTRFYKEREGAFTRKWQHLELVPAWTVIARYQDGEELRVKEDMVMVLPRHVLSIGEEWFYLGRPE